MLSNRERRRPFNVYYNIFADIDAGKADRFETEDDFLKAYKKRQGTGLVSLDDDNYMREDGIGDPIPKANFTQYYKTKNQKTIVTPNGQVIAAPGGDENVDNVVTAPGRGAVVTHNPDGTITEETRNASGMPKTPKINTNVDEGKKSTKYNPGDGYNARTGLNNQKGIYDLLNDYYGDSMSASWKNLSPEDRKILLFDQVGTMLKNAGKYRPKLYGAFGNVVDEGREAGDEQSLLQQGLKKSYEAGLTRRNDRLNNQLQQQLKIANFPEDLAMRFETEKIPNRLKIDLMRRLANEDYSTALQAYMRENPTKPIELAIQAVDATFGNAVKWIRGQ